MESDVWIPVYEILTPRITEVDYLPCKLILLIINMSISVAVYDMCERHYEKIQMVQLRNEKKNPDSTMAKPQLESFKIKTEDLLPWLLLY